MYAAAAGGAAAGAFTGGVGGLVVGTTSKVALGASAGVIQTATTEVVRTKGKSAGTPTQIAAGAATGGAMVGLSVTVMRGATSPKPSFSGCNQMFCWGENGGSVRKGAGDAVPGRGGDVTRRPSGFRKQTVQDAWDDAAPGSKAGTKSCPDCNTSVKVAPGQGRRDWDVDHQPKWKDRDLTGMTRQQVLDEYNKDVRLRCPGCNRSDNQ